MIDERDRKLIALLQDNARASFQELANALGMSASTVRRRVDRLISSGLIKLVAVPNWSQLGMHLTALIALSVELPRLREVATELAKMDEICFVAFATGDYDLFAQVVLPSNEDFVKFVTHRVAPLEGVRDLQTFMIPEFVKSFEQYKWPVRPNPLYRDGWSDTTALEYADSTSEQPMVESGEPATPLAGPWAGGVGEDVR